MNTNMVTSAFGRGMLIVKKFGPEILLGLGIASGVGAAVLACKATLIIDEVKNSNFAMLETVKDGRKEFNLDDYTEEAYRHDIVVVKVQSAMNYVRLYMPSIALGLTSVGLILASHGMLSKRYAGAVAAYNLVNESYKRYRERVIEDAGVEKDSSYLNGVRNEVVTEKSLDKQGNVTETEKTVTTSDSGDPTKVIFCAISPQFRTSWDHNLFFLKSQETYANHLLHSRGHVFLNEIYDSLGLPRTRDGAILGWVEGKGDNTIDFGLDDPINQKPKGANWMERSVYLTFNLHGIIYDLI